MVVMLETLLLSLLLSRLTFITRLFLPPAQPGAHATLAAWSASRVLLFLPPSSVLPPGGGHHTVFLHFDIIASPSSSLFLILDKHLVPPDRSTQQLIIQLPQFIQV